MERIHSRVGCLTARYSCLQASYWVVNCALYGFAAVYLQAGGFSAGEVGVVLALATLLSGVLQPVAAAFADRTGRISIRSLLAVLAVLGAAPLALLYGLDAGKQATAALFLLGALLIDLIQPLMNALSVYYAERGAALNFSIGRSAGSLGFAAASAMLGWLIAREGSDAMLLCCLAAYALFFLLALGFPVLGRTSSPEEPGGGCRETACSLPQFFRRYRRFCLSLTGILFLACFHLMTEHYLYQMMLRAGGTERDMGLNLSMSTLLEMAAILAFSRFGPRMRTDVWLKVSAAAFLAKAVCFAAASSVWMLHGAQLFQAASFGIYAPASVRYAKERVAPADMVKGQAMVAAFYTLGGSLGNFLGGQLIDRWGVGVMLAAGTAAAAAGAAILFLTVQKEEQR